MIQPKMLVGLNPREYEHPYDAQALDALQKVPALTSLWRLQHAVGRTAEHNPIHW